MAKFITELINVDLDDCRYSKIYKSFIVDEIEALINAGLPGRIEVLPDFIHDYESVPIIRGTSKRGGVVHDYLSRKNSIPIVTKKLAADVYFEIMEASSREKKQSIWNSFNMWWRKWLKYSVVRVAFDYFHKHNVEATYEEMTQ